MAGLLQQVPLSHPRVLGSREYLQGLAHQRPEAYARVVDVARNMRSTASHDDHGMRGKLMALGLVSVIEGDAKLGQEAAEIVRRVYLDNPVRVGHVGFGGDCWQAAMNYDLCHAYWRAEDRQRFYDYVSEAREKNLGEEPSVFHNGWYGMKMDGFILASLATVHENPRAEPLFTEVDREYHERAVPALKFAGAGGGFFEGYYTHYWIYDWVVTCHCLKACAGIDYFAAAPEFYKSRAIASMFEMYPTLREGATRRPVANGDSGGRQLHPERDKSMTAMRILVNEYRDDPAHQAVNAYTRQTPVSSFNFSAYRDFLFIDPTVPVGDLRQFKLSHFSHGAGNVHARGSWGEDSSYLFFHCGRRFTSHQHLDMNHFVVFKYEELLGDGGSYDSFDSPHCTNYYLRTIAHNTMLIHDPDEKYPAYIRAGGAAVNDGGQKYPWIGSPWGHNGGAWDLEMWRKNPELGEMGVMRAYEDTGDYVYACGDATTAYSEKKLECFTRQIVFLRPDYFVVFDRVRSTKAEFKKTFLLHTMTVPQKAGAHWLVGNGYGKLFIQTLLPADAVTTLHKHQAQFNYGGGEFQFEYSNGATPDCRMEISPKTPAKEDFFLHVFRTNDYNLHRIPEATVAVDGDRVTATIEGMQVQFHKNKLAGSVTLRGVRRELCAANLKAGGEGYTPA